MTTTTEYGSWVKAGDGTLSVEDSIAIALGDFGADYDLPTLAAAYRQAINDALPPSVSLCGDVFYGPCHKADQDFEGYPLTEDGALDIAAIVGSVDFWAIVGR